MATETVRGHKIRCDSRYLGGQLNIRDFERRRRRGEGPEKRKVKERIRKRRKRNEKKKRNKQTNKQMIKRIPPICFVHETRPQRGYKPYDPVLTPLCHLLRIFCANVLQHNPRVVPHKCYLSFAQIQSTSLPPAHLPHLPSSPPLLMKKIQECTLW